MIPKKITLHNFMSYGETNESLDFSAFDLACLSGPNGVGKSSLLEAITWSLWGKARSSSDDDLIHLGRDEMRVDFIFEIGGHTYRVIRKRKKGKQSDLQLFSLVGENFEPLQEATLRQTQSQIDKILHLSYETFINSAFIRQGKANEFTTKKPAQRKAILSDILFLSFYDLLERQARLRAREREIERQGLELYLRQNEEAIKKKDSYKKEYQNLQSKASNLKKELQKQEDIVSGLRDQVSKLNLTKKNLGEVEDSISKIKSEISNLEDEARLLEDEISQNEKLIKRKEEIEKGVDETPKKKLEEKLKKIILEIESLSILNKNVEAEGQKINEKIDILSRAQANCPLCGQSLDQSHKEKVKQQLIWEREKKRALYKKNQLNIKKLTKEKYRIEVEISKLDRELTKYKVLKERLSQSIALVKTQSQNRKKLKALIGQKKEEWRGKAAKLENLKKEIKRLGQLQEKLNEETQKLQAIRLKNDEIQNTLGSLKAQIHHLEDLEKELKKQEERLGEVVSEKLVYDELAFAFSKKGLQAMIIDQVIPEIEEEANEILARMTDSKMQIQLFTQKETKTTGEIVETLDIRISDEEGEREYDLYSGGEAFRVDFALRIALSKLLARRAGAKLQFLVIDEGFGTQDEEGLRRLVEAINSVSNYFAKIIVITHLEQLKDVFPVRIDVSKDKEGSHIRVLG